MRLAGAGVTTLCAAYIGIVVVGLSQTAVGPLITVPSGGNGLVAGFPDTSGIVPGLLATGGPGTARAGPPGAGAGHPVRRTARPAPRHPPLRPRARRRTRSALRSPAAAAGAKGTHGTA